MRILLLALLLGAILSLLCATVQTRIRKFLHHQPAAIWTLPVLLTFVFSFGALLAGAWTLPLSLLVLTYTALPVLCVWLARRQPADRPSLLDFAAILLIWLPLEFATGASLVPQAAQGYLHSVAYGIAILLGLVLFAALRGLPGLKYNLPRRRLDAWLPW